MTAATDSALLLDRFRAVRARTTQLCEPLSPEDHVVQSMPDASPVKWHLAHTSWFFETFVLGPHVQGYAPFHPAYKQLFNSYYEGVGPQFERAERGLLSRPTAAEVLVYRRHVDRAVGKALTEDRLSPRALEILELGLAHEEQHCELLLTDVKHMFSLNPLEPVYRSAADRPRASAPALEWLPVEAGLREIGHAGGEFAFDNEGPRHRVWLDAYQVASRPVTVGEYREFIEDDGYERPDLWLSEGWDAVKRRGWRTPAYWRARGNGWGEFTLAGARAIDPHAPVCHVSFFEADAYARWAGARLPSEAEWEVAAAAAAPSGRFSDSDLLHPAPAPSVPAGAAAQLFGDVWEWTSSPYSPYPGYAPSPGALGEYNGKFMVSQLVLRGGSVATPPSHVRSTYRNFFHPDKRWQFSGLRLARGAR